LLKHTESRVMHPRLMIGQSKGLSKLHSCCGLSLSIQPSSQGILIIGCTEANHHQSHLNEEYAAPSNAVEGGDDTQHCRCPCSSRFLTNVSSFCQVHSEGCFVPASETRRLLSSSNQSCFTQRPLHFFFPVLKKFPHGKENLFCV
jgi:hypothetical protein